jgi:hypothetical protein
MWRVTSASQVAPRTECLRRLQLRLIEFGDRCDVWTAAARYVAMVFDGTDNSDDLSRLWWALRVQWMRLRRGRRLSLFTMLGIGFWNEIRASNDIENS